MTVPAAGVLLTQFTVAIHNQVLMAVVPVRFSADPHRLREALAPPGQELDPQLDAFSQHGIPRNKIFSEKISTRVRSASRSRMRSAPREC
ncbi:hypothetical protein [Streptomyces lasalocidi]|uniref:hypothetical protein n=1 Tax=Streptomyces lasalocidi TaxID=324833 RepID=UPI001F501525|nr:hypothetical protein [Streptomyces lasalocidi]